MHRGSWVEPWVSAIGRSLVAGLTGAALTVLGGVAGAQQTLVEPSDSELGSRPIVQGLVVAPDGSGVADAVVSVRSNPRFLTAGEPRVEAEVTTDAAGRFHLENPAKVGHVFRLRVEAPGFLRLDRETLTLDETLRFELEPATWVRGRVVDRDGRPVAEARWQVWIDVGSRLPKMPQSLLRSGTTDASGRFEAQVPPGGQAKLEVEHGGWEGVSEPFDLHAGGVSIPDVVLDDPVLLLQFLILGPEGTAPPEATELVLHSGGERRTVSNLGVDAEGHTSVRWSPDMREVTVRHPAFEPATYPLDLRADEFLPSEAPWVAGVSEILTLRLGPPRDAALTVGGTVVDPTGKPIAKASVRLEAEVSARGGVTVETNPEGRWQTVLRAPGVYELSAHRQGWLSTYRAVTLDGSRDDVHVTLTRGGTLEGRILGLEPQHLDRLHLAVHEDRRHPRVHIEIDRSTPPSYRIEGIPLQGARLQAQLGYPALPRDLGPLSFDGDDRNATVQRDITLEPGFAVHFTATVDGMLVQEAVWHLDCAERGEASGVLTASDGEWTLLDATEGPCALELRANLGHDDGLGTRQPIWLSKPGQRFDLALATHRLRGRIDGITHRPESSLVLSTPQAPDRRLETLPLGPEGQFDFGRVAEGPTLLQLLDSELEVLASWQLEIERDLEIELTVDAERTARADPSPRH